MKIWYSVDGDERFSYEARDQFCADVAARHPDALAMLAEECADNFHNQRDGHAYDWPIVLRLFIGEDDELPLGAWRIVLDYEPTFTAIEEEKG